MKNRCIIYLFTLILVIFGLFAACAGASGSASKHDPKPDPDLKYKVTFQANGGKPAPNPQYIADGGKVVMPLAMTKTGYGFGGWYKEWDYINEWDFAADTVTDNITLYAKWDMNYYTVSFNANDGNPAPNSQNIIHGGKVVMPLAMTKTGYIFGGWYKEAACTNEWNFATDTVTSNITLYAQWNTSVVSGTSLADKLQWLSINAVSNSDYILEVTADEDLEPQNLSYSGKSNITIQLKGTGSSRVITLWNAGSLFSIGNGVTLILEENLILKGKNSNNASLVQVNSGGTLIMNQSVKISGNTNTSYDGVGGVYVGSGGTFTMSGGEISGNTASYGGGGVYVDDGTFTMNGGEISGNTARLGGGVYMGDGTFMMNGGKISGNTAASSSYDNGGGGVFMRDGTFTMSGGEISGNTASYSSSYGGGGGGVCVNGTFTMSGGEISGNTASFSSYSSSSSSYGGGGVYVNGTFTMSGGEISGNTASFSSYSYSNNGGGGVYVNGTFTMSGGEISGNTASFSSYSSLYSCGGGGGVYVKDSSTFIKSGGGTITGYASNMVNGNEVKNDSGVQNSFGHAVYAGSSKYRETTAGPEVNLNSKVSGTAGGWE